MLAVVVVHERDIEQVEAWSQLQAALHVDAARTDGLRLVHVLVYDNSRTPRAKAAGAVAHCSYVQNPQNGGTAAAYVSAANLAQQLGLNWLLLLDHDTRLPSRFFEQASVAVEDAGLTHPAAALLPWVYHGDRVVSPARITWTGSVRPLNPRVAVSDGSPLTGIASGSLIEVTAWRAIEPLPPGLWLDYVDHWTFARLRALGRRIVVFDAKLEHDLSIATPSSVGRGRMQSILDGERSFVGVLPWPARVLHPLRLALRLGRQVFKYPRGALDLLSWMLWRRGNDT